MPDNASVPVRRTLLIRPTRSASLLLLLAIILELLGRLIGSTGVTVAAAAALGAVLGDAALAPRFDGLLVRRVWPRRMTVGVPAVVSLSFQVPERRRGVARQIVVSDTHPAVPPGRVLCPRLRPGSTVTARREVTAPRRGHWVGGAIVQIEAFSPLGGFVRRCTLTFDNNEFFVHPVPARPIRLPDVSTAYAAGTASSTRSGTGINLFGVREWRPGDPPGEIHWRATARRGQFIVRERERPGQTALTIAVGGSAAGDAWEARIARATATAVAAVRSGRSVGLLDASGLASPTSIVEILDWFASTRGEADPDAGALLSATRLAGRGGTVLWVGAAAIGPALERAARGGGTAAVLSIGHEHVPGGGA